MCAFHSRGLLGDKCRSDLVKNELELAYHRAGVDIISLLCIACATNEVG